MNANEKIAIIGLGPVGLTLAVALAPHFFVLGLDKNELRITELINQHDRLFLFTPKTLAKIKINFTNNAHDLADCNIYIICVPTPLSSHKQPDLSALLSATDIVSKHLKKSDIVIYESTVFPGTTEEYCIPILENNSQLKCNVEFGVGYSPERINPGDHQHTLKNTPKIIAASNKQTLNKIQDLYSKIIETELITVSTIKSAEAVKIVENTQRDILISFFNEMAITLHHFGLDTNEVFNAASSKWNFISLKPGLVGGDCIATDPYYLIYQAKKIGYYPRLVATARQINDGLAKFIAESCIKQLLQIGTPIKGANVAVLGITFKENYPSTSNSKVINLINELKTYKVNVIVHDPIIDIKLIKKQPSFKITPWNNIQNMDAIIITQAHQQYKNLTPIDLKQLLTVNGLIVDIKGIYAANQLKQHNINYWRL